MIVSAPTFRHVRAVASQMRAKDRTEFMAVSSASTHADLVERLVQLYGDNDATYCFSDDDGEPIGAGAMIEARPNVVTLMFMATDRFNTIALPLAKFCRRRLFPKYRALGVHRIECIALDGYDENHRWIEMLDMEREGVLRGFGRNGETFHQFAWVADYVR